VNVLSRHRREPAKLFRNPLWLVSQSSFASEKFLPTGRYRGIGVLESSMIARSNSRPAATPRAATTDVTSTQDGHDGERNMVAVYSSAADFDKLRHALSPLSHAVVEHCDWSDDGPASSNRFVAAVITDSIERPLELCARVSKLCPVLLVTQNCEFEFRLAATRAGVGALLFTPLDANELIDWLEHLIGLQNSPPASILVLDDDYLLAELYAMALSKAGIDVYVVDTATAAFERLNASLPDLILMDVQMPGVDGIEIARMIRQSRRYLSVPIVFVSGECDAVRQMEARRFGGDEFVSKPVDLKHLVALVHLRAERAKLMRSIMERDSLTGLLNHSRFKERLAHELERCRRTGGEISLAMIDLDRFKLINDTHGHLIGDRVIRALSTSLMSGLRKIDIIGRYGGEEFGVIMLDTPSQAAHAAIEKQCRCFGEIEFDAAGQRFHATFSAGLAGSRAHAGIEGIIAAADRALYAAKQDGRNRVTVDARADGTPRGG
jgi:diguanylate cyclase (GGDEF)-like protein